MATLGPWRVLLLNEDGTLPDEVFDEILASAPIQQGIADAEAAANRAEAAGAVTVNSGTVVGNDLILTRNNGTLVNAGSVRGLPGPGAVTNDVACAALINTPGSLTDLALSSIFQKSAGIPIEKFLNTGEAFDYTNTTSMSTIIQRAIDTVPTSFGRLQLLFGPGNIRLGARLNFSTAPSRAGIGIRGSGRDRTTFTVDSTVLAAFQGYGDSTLSTPTKLSEMHFSDFTIDCSNQLQDDTTSAKGFILGHLFNCRFENIRILNSWATSFGCDFLVNVWFVNCDGFNAGRGLHINTVSGSGSTFGIGTGAYNNESMYFINCRSNGARRMGWNLEWLHEYGISRKTKVFIQGGYAKGDAIGIGDLGTGGVYVADFMIEDFTAAAILIGGGGQSTIGGSNGYIAPSVTIRNGKKGPNSFPYQDIYGAHGVYLRVEGGGGYIILPTIEDIEGVGVYVEPGFRLTPGGIVIGPRVYRAAGGGLSWRNGSRLEPGVVLRDGYYEDCGTTAMDLRSAFLGLVLTDNQFVSHGALQKTSVRFDPTLPVISPMIQQNVSYDVTAFLTGDTNFTGTPLVSSNPIIVTPAVDPSETYYDSLRASPTTSAIGDWNECFAANVFTQHHTWEKTKEGMQPRPGGTGNSGASGRWRDVNRIGVKLTAAVAPRGAAPGRRGIIMSYDATTGDCMVYENFSSFYQWVRYNAGVRTVIRTFGDKAFNERHEVGLSQVPGNNEWNAYMDGELVHTYSTSTIVKNTKMGVWGTASGEGYVNSFNVRPI